MKFTTQLYQASHIVCDAEVMSAVIWQPTVPILELIRATHQGKINTIIDPKICMTQAVLSLTKIILKHVIIQCHF